VGSTSRLKPAEEQFIEQNPWANPQHPSHAHLLHRQTSSQQAPRTTSPFSQLLNQSRRPSNQQASGGPISGTFSTPSSLMVNTNGSVLSGGRISPHNPFSNPSHSHAIVPSPLGSRQPSLSPQQNRQPPALSGQQQQNRPMQDGHVNNGNPIATSTGHPRDFPQEIRKENGSAMMGQF